MRRFPGGFFGRPGTQRPAGLPARKTVRSIRQVSWLAGRCLFHPAFPAGDRQWTMGGGLAAYSCGDSLGVGQAAAPSSLLAPGIAARRTMIEAQL